MLKKRLIGMIILFSFIFLIFGCTSVPEVKRYKYDEEKKAYDVVIDRDYIDDPAELKYAINSFVKDMGGTSYDVVQHGSNDYYVTIPGKTPVEDLPEVRNFHVFRTVLAIVLPSAGLLTSLMFILPML